ncbi:MAG: winged helix-turn-helix domain-containing protein, partial [Chloroflexi bacterium]|nr:winged helix-turn-helix domain-containing protein [Chloroflexota bacterium]
TLLADHTRRTSRPTAWYRLESGDRDWATALNYLVAAFRQVLTPEFGTGTINLLRHIGVLDATRDMAVDSFLVELEAAVTTPVTLVLDDFHVVADSEDFRDIALRLLEHAPVDVSFVLAGRDLSGFPTARLATQGSVVEIGSEELRFTRRETADLLTFGYGVNLDDDLVRILDERLRGWGASLQLVGTSLVSLRPSEVRRFVEDLTFRPDPLYDFLAEEVLDRLPSATRRVLTVASVLERIDPRLVTAAMATERSITARKVETSLSRAEASGLVVPSPHGDGSWHFHPLVRDYLLSRLITNVPRRSLLDMHLRIAKAAEPIDWLASAFHYVEAEHLRDAMRVLRDSAILALGTATWGPVSNLVDRMPDEPIPAAVSVVRARALIARGRSPEAVVVLQMLAIDAADTSTLALTQVTLAYALMVAGRLGEARQSLDGFFAVANQPKVPESIAQGYRAVLAARDGGSLPTALDVLTSLGREHERLGLPYYAAVSYHNAALVSFARGQYESCIKFGTQSIENFRRTTLVHGMESTHAIIAVAALELGRQSTAEAHLDAVSTDEGVPADAQAHAAWIATAVGDSERAWVLLERAARSALDEPTEPGAVPDVQYAKALAHLADGDAEAAAAALLDAEEGSLEMDATCRDRAVSSLVALLQNDLPRAIVLAEDGARLADHQGAAHWQRWCALVLAVAKEDAQAYRQATASLFAYSLLSVEVLADAIVRGIGLVEEVPDQVVDRVRSRPRRWLPVLRRTVESGSRESSAAAAVLLSAYGTTKDVAVLSAFERRHFKQPSRRQLAQSLARRTKPTLVIHDLGRVRLQLGPRVLHVSQTRRRASSLLAFLATRPEHAAMREQVLETLWPNQTPEGAANSLHQTLFFLRRELNPDHDESRMVDYVVVEGETVVLDSELVLVDSAAFYRQASAALSHEDIHDVGPAIVRDYTAKFALEFEYEDWAAAWRDRLHSLYLELVQVTAEALIRENRVRVGTDLIGRALTLDPEALELEASLIHALLNAGATAAAKHQYDHYAQVYEREFGEPPPPLHASDAL